jgi:hypothetical protein
MPIRNPFAKRTGVSNGLEPVPDEEHKPAFERVDTMGSKSSSALSIKSGKSQEPAEYKMSGERTSLRRCPTMPGVFASQAHGIICRIVDHLLTNALCAVVNDSGVYLPVFSMHP